MAALEDKNAESDALDPQEEEEEEDDRMVVNTVFGNQESYDVKHPLENKWTFWFDNPQAQGRRGQRDWHENLVKIYTVSTIEDFWAVYNNLVTVDKMAEGSNYHFFKEGIEPTWEDPQNRKGGKWTAMLPRGSNLNPDCWLKTLLLIIGEQFENFAGDIRGAVFARRKHGDKLAVWTSNAESKEACLSIGQTVFRVLGIPLRDFSYQAHEDSVSKGSSTIVSSRYTINS